MFGNYFCLFRFNACLHAFVGVEDFHQKRKLRPNKSTDEAWHRGRRPGAKKRGRVIFSDADWGTGHKHGGADNTFFNFFIFRGLRLEHH
jgi:hypothetical protein